MPEEAITGKTKRKLAKQLLQLSCDCIFIYISVQEVTETNAAGMYKIFEAINHVNI